MVFALSHITDVIIRLVLVDMCDSHGGSHSFGFW